jgi:hypothetical protein
MSKSKLRVAFSLTSAIVLMTTAGIAVAKPDKKPMAETALPLPKNEPVANIAQAEPVPAAAAPAKEEQIPPPTMDTNGDNKPDAWDRDANGAPDAWDLDGDGKPDALDNDGDGKPDPAKKDEEMKKPDAQPR